MQRAELAGGLLAGFLASLVATAVAGRWRATRLNSPGRVRPVGASAAGGAVLALAALVGLREVPPGW